nr:MAG TPA: hypothetical protein [Caudoviricetes sp.]
MVLAACYILRKTVICDTTEGQTPTEKPNRRIPK